MKRSVGGGRGFWSPWKIAQTDAIHNYAYKQLFCLFNAISDGELEGRTCNDYGIIRKIGLKWGMMKLSTRVKY